MKLPYKDLGDIFDSIDKSSYNWVQQFASAIIEANNAEVLADLKPVARFIYEHGHLTQVRLQNKDGIDLYSAETVSAIIQDRDALAARVKELEGVDTQESPCLECPNFMTGCPGGCKLLKATP